MKHNSYLRHILTACLLVNVSFLHAQLDQSIAVDGKYTPEIIRIDRINMFPLQEKFSMDTEPLTYQGTGIPASFLPVISNIPPSGWKDIRKYSNYKGYVELGAGSYLNSTLSAGYRIVDDFSGTLGIRFQHNSTSLWKPRLLPEYNGVRQYRYDEALGIYGSHNFKNIGEISGAVDYHIGNFNYYGFAPEWGDACAPIHTLSVPAQTLNDISARVGWKSALSKQKIQYNASLGVRYFGYRSFYLPELDPSVNCIRGDIMRVPSTRETDINIRGGIIYSTSSKSSLGLDLNSDILCYGGYDYDNLPSPSNYGMIGLTPYYRFSIYGFLLRLGAAVDFSANAGEKGNKYGVFHIAPAIRVDYNAGPARLYMHLDGGSRLHTLASGYELDYYQQPFLTSTRPVYTPLDGALGISFGPIAGFSADFDFAFKVSRGEYLGGWYTTMLNNLNFATAPGLAEFYNGHSVDYSYSPDETLNMHGFSIGAKLCYEAGNIFSVEASGHYQPQNGTKGYFNGYDRPRITARAAVKVNPWKKLVFSLAYDYRGVRNCYTKGTVITDSGLTDNILQPMRLPDLTMLGFNASYGFSDRFTVWLQGDNLINRHILLLPGLPQQGISFAGGFSFLF